MDDLMDVFRGFFPMDVWPPVAIFRPSGSCGVGDFRAEAAELKEFCGFTI